MRDAVRVISVASFFATRCVFTARWFNPRSALWFLGRCIWAYPVYAIDLWTFGGRLWWWWSPWFSFKYSRCFGFNCKLLKQAGWQTGLPWGFEVKIPQGVSIAGESRRNKKSLNSWIEQGLIRADGTALIQGNLSGSTPAGLISPAGANGPVFLVF